jgi:hypothetical protein
MSPAWQFQVRKILVNTLQNEKKISYMVGFTNDLMRDFTNGRIFNPKLSFQ